MEVHNVKTERRIKTATNGFDQAEQQQQQQPQSISAEFSLLEFIRVFFPEDNDTIGGNHHISITQAKEQPHINIDHTLGESQQQQSADHKD